MSCKLSCLIRSAVVLVTLLASVCPASAEETAKALDFTIHQEYSSPRARGMGNAFTAVADDYTALFYNPAALARRKDGHLRLSLLRIGLDDSYKGLVDDIDAADNEGTEDQQIDAINEVINNNKGNHFYSRISALNGMMVRPGWGLAFVPLEISTDIAIHNNLGPSLHVSSYADSTLAYGYGREFKWFGKHQFAMGATLKALHRVQVSKQVLASSLVSDEELINESDAAKGVTVDIDLGTMLTLDWKRVVPTFAVVVRNALDYGFTIKTDKEANEPSKLQRRIDLGSAWELPNLWVFEPTVAFDIRDIGHSNWSLEKGVHIGAEMYWTMYNWWKGHWSVGLNQGYPTAGFGARLAWFQLDLTTFGEEVGTSSEKRESRRYMVEMSLDF